MAEKPRNVIILCPDEQRGDAAGFMGNPDIKTPNMDRLAQRSAIFERHMTTFPKCVPARCSLMTGRYTHTDGWRSVSQALEPGQPELMSHLRERGYETAVFGKNHCWDEANWDALDFSSDKPPMAHYMEGRRGVHEFPASEDGPQPMDLDPRWHYVGSNTRHMPDEAFTEQTVDYLRERRDRSKPFFLQVNYESPHAVYGVEEPWYSMYDRDKIEAYPHDLPKNAPLPVTAQRKYRTGMEDHEAEAREIQAVYYGMISKLDHLFGKVLDAVDAENLWEDTVILFISDHGDYAGQYTLVEKYDTHFADCLMQVPCTLYAPDLPAGRVSSLSDTADIAPTLCELLGVEPLPHMHGESMVPLARGEKRKDAVFADGGHEKPMRDRFAAREKPTGDHGNALGKGQTYWYEPDSMARAKMVRTDRYKLVIRETGGNELYDLETDPWEMDNRWGDPELAAATAELMRKLVEWSLKTDPERPYLENFTV
ncbi:MAG: sulfatase-like hydrolase/transferase [Phycisphaeraceae bacterium]